LPDTASPEAAAGSTVKRLRTGSNKLRGGANLRSVWRDRSRRRASPPSCWERSPLALLLAGFSLYGVMAYSVAQRSREIGIRIALGAQSADVRALVVNQAARLGAAGLIIGIACALAVTRVLDSLLFGVTASDPLTFAGVSAALITVLLLAAYLPARRATRVDPIVALRAD
jgi:predicted lysophospholipase L1 biosynthesis ABC-type transport system permease subunit